MAIQGVPPLRDGVEIYIVHQPIIGQRLPPGKDVSLDRVTPSWEPVAADIPLS